MNVKRTATLGVLGVAVAVWLAAAATSGVRQPTRIVVPNTAVLDASGADLAVEIARLHDWLHPTVEPSQARDLFRYAARPVGRGALADAPPPVAQESPVSAPALPSLTLVGIAEDEGDAGAVRTAIISGSAGQLFLVKEGEAVTSRYRVANIGSDLVELTDLTSNTTLRLALK